MARPKSEKLSAPQTAAQAESPQTTPQTAPQTTPQSSARIYKGSQVLDHDLFKLKAAPMLKNVSFSEENPRYEEFDHCHIFHTIDSNGRMQDATNAVGGHHHMVTVVKTAGGVPRLEISKAMKFIKQKTREGRFKKVAVEVEHDDHTHEYEYMGSEKIQLRQPNIEFAKYEAQVKARQEMSVDGVTTG